jgi:small subunit ribosomal protein S8
MTTIANFISTFKNAAFSNKKSFTMDSSKKLESITRILFEEGFIEKYQVNDIKNNKKTISVFIKYRNKSNVFTDIKQISKPGLRIYRGINEVPCVLNGLGLAILSTNKGIISDKNARENNVGGEYILKI